MVDVKSRAGSDTLDERSIWLIDASDGPVTMTLTTPTPVTDATVKKTDTTSNAVTIETPGGETIDGAASISLTTEGATRRIISDGDNYVTDKATAADDTFPGFQTDITTDGFASVFAAFTMNSTTSEAAVLQVSYDGGSTWTTIESHPGGLSDKTVSVSPPIGPTDTLQFRDNSGGSAGVTNDDYHKRDLP